MSDETTKPDVASAEKPRAYTQAEIDKMRKADIDDYKKENAWLEQRVKNVTFLADLEVQETRRLMALAQRYQLLGINPEAAASKEQPTGEKAPVSEKPSDAVNAESGKETGPLEEKPMRVLKKEAAKSE